MTARSLPGRLRDVHRERAVLLYLVLVGALLVWAFVVTLGDSSGESMAGVVPLIATAPASLTFLLLPAVLPDNVLMFVVCVALGAEVNAAAIGWCARTLRRRIRNG